MRISVFVIAAAFCASLASVAGAQSAPPATVPSAAPPITAGATQSHWTTAGFVGSNFGNSSVDPSVSFGGQLAYLWKGMVGGEAIADFAPAFNVDDAALSESPRMNAYMGNAIFAMPLGARGQFEPYVSGGAGSIQLVARAFNIALPHLSGTFPTGTSQGDAFTFGTNVGGGVMGFNGMIGFRADVRYYKAHSNQTIQAATPIGQFTETLLSGLDFWRANIGIAVRW